MDERGDVRQDDQVRSSHDTLMRVRVSTHLHNSRHLHSSHRHHLWHRHDISIASHRIASHHIYTNTQQSTRRNKAHKAHTHRHTHKAHSYMMRMSCTCDWLQTHVGVLSVWCRVCGVSCVLSCRVVVVVVQTTRDSSHTTMITHTKHAHTPRHGVYTSIHVDVLAYPCAGDVH